MSNPSARVLGTPSTNTPELISCRVNAIKKRGSSLITPKASDTALGLPTVRIASGPKLATPVNLTDLPDKYAMALSGDCMEPHLHDGARAAFSKVARPEMGDFVVVWFKPESIPENGFRGFFKKLARPIPHFVTFPWEDHPESDLSPALVLEMFNPPRKLAVPCRNIAAIHKCIGVAQ